LLRKAPAQRYHARAWRRPNFANSAFVLRRPSRPRDCPLSFCPPLGVRVVRMRRRSSHKNLFRLNRL
jgi:hypothetical protein